MVTFDRSINLHWEIIRRIKEKVNRLGWTWNVTIISILFATDFQKRRDGAPRREAEVRSCRQNWRRGELSYLFIKFWVAYLHDSLMSYSRLLRIQTSVREVAKNIAWIPLPDRRSQSVVYFCFRFGLSTKCKGVHTLVVTEFGETDFQMILAILGNRFLPLLVYCYLDFQCAEWPLLLHIDSLDDLFLGSWFKLCPVPFPILIACLHFFFPACPILHYQIKIHVLSNLPFDRLLMHTDT